MVAFRKFGLLDHIDGTVDARLRLDDTEWSQIDYGVVLWLYTTVSQEILDIILKPDDTAYAVWAAIHNIFLGNRMQRAVYAQQEFHSLYQGDLSITAYFRRLKQLADTLRDVGSPVSDQALVLNMLRGLSSKFSHAISNMTLGQLPTFINARSYLLGEERRLAHTAAMEAATALYAGAAAGTRAIPGASNPLQGSNSSQGGGSSNSGRRNRNKSKKGNGGSSSGGARNPQPAAPVPSWPPGTFPWPGMFQAWPVPRAPLPAGAGVLGPRLGTTAPMALHATSTPVMPLPAAPVQAAFPYAPLYAAYAPQFVPGIHQFDHGSIQPTQPSTPRALWDQAPLVEALNNLSMQSSTSPSSEWFLDTGASSHMTANPGQADLRGSTPM